MIRYNQNWNRGQYSGRGNKHHYVPGYGWVQSSWYWSQATRVMERDWDLQHTYGTMGSNWHGQATRRLGIDRKAEEAARSPMPTTEVKEYNPEYDKVVQVSFEYGGDGKMISASEDSEELHTYLRSIYGERVAEDDEHQEESPEGIASTKKPSVDGDHEQRRRVLEQLEQTRAKDEQNNEEDAGNSEEMSSAQMSYMNMWKIRREADKQRFDASLDGGLTTPIANDHHTRDDIGGRYSNEVFRGHYRQGDMFLAPDGHVHKVGGGGISASMKQREAQLRVLLNYSDHMGAWKSNSTASPTNILMYLNTKSPVMEPKRTNSMRRKPFSRRAKHSVDDIVSAQPIVTKKGPSRRLTHWGKMSTGSLAGSNSGRTNGWDCMNDNYAQRAYQTYREWRRRWKTYYTWYSGQQKRHQIRAAGVSVGVSIGIQWAWLVLEMVGLELGLVVVVDGLE